MTYWEPVPTPDRYLEPPEPTSDDPDYCFECGESPCECVANMIWARQYMRKQRGDSPKER
jgi:hypothetical protein